MFGFDRPPRAALLVLLALVVANVGIFGYLATRPSSADSYIPQAAVATSTVTAPSTAESTPVAETETPVETPVLAVYGDGYTAGSRLGGTGTNNWAALVAAQAGAELRSHAVPMAGYATAGSTGQTFADMVAAQPEPDADVVVLFGSRNDLNAGIDAVHDGAAAVMQAVTGAPQAPRLVVVGPAWSSADVPDQLLSVRNAVQQAAADAGAVFIDPLAEGWFAEPAELIASDGVSPTDAGHRYLADHIAAAVVQALDAA